MYKKTESNENAIKGLTEKIKDLAILDMFKSSVNEVDEKALVSSGETLNFDTKGYTTKYKDERHTKNEEDIYKLKADLNNLKNTQDNLNRTVKTNKESIETINPQVSDLKGSLKILNNQIISDLKKQLDQLSSLLNIKIKEYDNKLSDFNTQLKPFSNSQIQDKEDDKTSPIEINHIQNQQPQYNDISKQLLDLRRHMIEAEKNINKIQPDNLLQEIKAIKDELGQKCSINKHTELSIIVNDQSKKIEILKDQIFAHIEDSVGHEDTKAFKKKIEFLMSSLFQIKQSSSNNDNSIQNNQSLGNLMMDSTNKYLELSTFKEFKENLLEQLTYLNDHINENRKLIDDILPLLKHKVSNKEMKEMEEVIMGKLEDLKLACQRKFADKIEVGKNIKFLDAQMKNILEINIHKSEKRDSWLLANKPLGGHNCASCENYLGDLKETNQYIPWNKYPMRDQNEKLYRLGNGFSKMLQMVGSEPVLDKKDGRDQFTTSQDFFSSKAFKKEKEKDRSKESDKEREMTSPHREQYLPKLKLKINSSLSNLSDNDIVQDQSNLSQEEDNSNNPKM